MLGAYCMCRDCETARTTVANDQLRFSASLSLSHSFTAEQSSAASDCTSPDNRQSRLTQT